MERAFATSQQPHGAVADHEMSATHRRVRYLQRGVRRAANDEALGERGDRSGIRTAHDGEGHFLGLHAFALEEGGRLAEAERAAERALATNPRDTWAVHALAHALYEGARFADGITRLPPAIHPCRGLNWFRNHLVWHLALLHFARGDYARAATISRRAFERTPSSIAGDLHDSISLLWRMELAGRPMGARWQPFTAIARERTSRQGLAFHVCHVGMALAAGGDWAGAERHLAVVRERASKDRTGLTNPLFSVGEAARYPITIYPLAVQIFFCVVVPFAFVAFFPAAWFCEQENWGRWLGLGPLVALAGLLWAVFLFGRGLRVYESAGS